MQIGQLVQRHVPAIFDHCTQHDPAEFVRLQDPRYSKDRFDINYPFCKAVNQIGPDEHRRYYSREYRVQNVAVRVTNHWFNPPTSESKSLLILYMRNRGIVAMT